MADIAPELYEKIKESFDRKYAQAQLFGGSMSEMVVKINNGTATFQDANIYASMVGGFMADAMKENLILDELPGKRLYSNIARKTIGEGLKDTYGIVSAAAKVAQAEHNAAAKIGLKPVQPKLETKRVDNIVNKAAASKTQQELNAMLETAVPTFARQVVDDTQKANARQHNRAGLEVKVEREYDGVGLHGGTDVCDWCLQRAGTWTYDKAMANGVFERHEGCGCIITYTSAKGKVTVSTGKNSGWVDRDKWIAEEQRILSEQDKLNVNRLSFRNLFDETNARSTQELQTAADKLKTVADTYTVTESKWSGRLKVNNLYKIDDRISGRKAWNCDIVIIDTATDGDILHELLHAHSISQYDKSIAKRIYAEHKNIEEATTEYLTQQICKAEGLTAGNAYGGLVRSLKTLYPYSGCDSELEFAQQLFAKPLQDRYNWLKENTHNNLALKIVSKEQRREISKALRLLKYGN